MKVLQVNTVCGIGSTGRIAVELYDELLKNNYTCKIGFGRGIAQEGIKTIKIGNKISTYVNVIKARIFDNAGFDSKYSTKKLIKKIDEYNPDIIHLHNLHGYYLDIESLFMYLKKSNKPVIWTLHDCWALTGHCTYFDNIECNKWKTGCEKCPQKKVYPKSIVFDKSKPNYLKKVKLYNEMSNQITIVSVSKWLNEKVRESILKEANRIVIYNGVDTNVFKPTYDVELVRKHKLNNKFIILGVASDWDERKGLKKFWELSKNISISDIIVLIGLSEEQIKKLPENIMGINKIKNQNELIRWYSSADVLVNFSVEETFGLVTVEAMACGTPVIGINRTATPELITENTGILINKGEENEIYKEIKKIKKDGKEKYIEACVNHVKTNFSAKQTYKKYMELYSTLYSKRKSR